MSVHRLPVRSDLQQLQRQAKELLRAIHSGDATAIAELREHGGGPLREYRDVTPLGWGEQYHARIFVSRESLRLIEARGGSR